MVMSIARLLLMTGLFAALFAPSVPVARADTNIVRDLCLEISAVSNNCYLLRVVIWHVYRVPPSPVCCLGLISLLFLRIHAIHGFFTIPCTWNGAAKNVFRRRPALFRKLLLLFPRFRISLLSLFLCLSLSFFRDIFETMSVNFVIFQWKNLVNGNEV